MTASASEWFPVAASASEWSLLRLSDGPSARGGAAGAGLLQFRAVPRFFVRSVPILLVGALAVSPLPAATPQHFTTSVPAEGNYRVSVVVGDATGPSSTTIKAELRRLMVEKVETRAGEFTQVDFIVNVRTPGIAAASGVKPGRVELKVPRETVQEAVAWDRAITLEFAGSRPVVRSVDIAPVEVPTVFLLGDSTVCDQPKEPYASWGQMLPRFFGPSVAIANHAESGETYRDSLARRRLDKILSVARPGDWLLLQFGHNDQKQIAAGTGAARTTYRAELKQHVDAFRARGGQVILISPMERRGFDAAGKVKSSLLEYAEATRDAAAELGVPFIDLNAASKELYEALGPDGSVAAFAVPKGKVDNTHHNNYGSYQLAKIIVQAIHDQQLPLARHVIAGWQPYSPTRPDDPAAFAVPESADFSDQRPLGD